MTEAYRDGNFVTTLLGTSSSDGVTPINVYVDPVTHRLLVDIDGGSGTVTSVSFTGGLISVATATTTPAFTVAGTSGGIPYFSSASTWATSAALAANAIVIGGGAGAAPATTTTGTGVLTALGINVGSTGAFVTFNGALGTPSSGTVTNLTGTASININGTVGATTPAAGTFTTGTINTSLTMADAANIVLSGGTANGVLYLNGSKVATSGSALTFDGALLATSGKVHSGSTTGSNFQLFSYQNASTGSSATFVVRQDGTDPIAIFQGASGSEQMRLTSNGNLLIGTTSQVYSEKLAVQNDQNSSTYQLIRNNNSGSSAASGLSLNAYGNSWGIEVGSAAKNSNALTFSVDYLGTPVEKMRLTTDGNIGLGTTPSAWHSNFRVLQTGSGYASFVGDSSNGYAEVLNNCYASGASTYNYLASLAVTRYSQQLGVHKWYVAAAGTAGNTITFTEVMTIGSNGNVGINNSSPSYKLDVSGTGHFTKTVSFDEFDNGNSGTADTIDWTQGNKQKSTLTGNCTFTFTAPGGPASLILKLVQDATGSRTVTWPAAVHWSGGTAPTLTTTANKVDIITFYYDGTTYFGNSTLNFTA